MRLLKRILLKFIMMVITVMVFGAVLRAAKPHIMKSAGMPEGMPGAESLANAQFSSEESDLMATVFKSALRFITGSGKRDEVAGELSDKLYGDRPGASQMSELGIELEKPGAPQMAGAGAATPVSSSSVPGTGTRISTARQNEAPAAKTGAVPGASPQKPVANGARDALLGGMWEKAQANPELALVPIVLPGMLVIGLVRRRRSPKGDFVLPDLSKLLEAESGPYQMQYPVHCLPAEEFEMLIAFVYHRQGYRVTMPAGLGCGRRGDFTAQRKSERLLVQCRRLRVDDDVSVDRVRELHEAAAAAGVTRGVYVASGGFSWDARNFAKVKGVTMINARMLDALLTEALAKEDVLEIPRWAPELMSKVKLSPPLCPACEAPMDEVTSTSNPAWLCNGRPACRGRRTARKSAAALSVSAAIPAGLPAPAPVAKPNVAVQPSATNPDEAGSPAIEATQRRARTIVPASAGAPPRSGAANPRPAGASFPRTPAPCNQTC